MKKLLFFAIVGLACAQSERTVAPEITQAVQKTDQTQKKSLDLSVLIDDPWIIQYRVQSAHSSSLPGVSTPRESEKTGGQRIIGYRIQIFSTADYHAALEFRDRAAGMMSGNIYLDYEQPYYKVRIGNYEDREEAEGAKQAVKDLGFRDAWVVRTRILRSATTTQSERGKQ